MAPPDCRSQAEYIGYFEDALAVMQTEAALERTARELGEDSAAENIDYLEVRWAPLLHRRAGLTAQQVIEAVLRGLAAAPLRAVAIVCAMRQQAVVENVELARLAADCGRTSPQSITASPLVLDQTSGVERFQFLS